jgi:hypothetical protein
VREREKSGHFYHYLEKEHYPVRAMKFDKYRASPYEGSAEHFDTRWKRRWSMRCATVMLIRK